MINLEELAPVADFRTENGDAVSFYLSEERPENLAHRRELLDAKDSARGLLRGGHDTPAMRQIVERLIERSEQMREEQRPGTLAIFACTKPEMWHEISLPYATGSAAFVGQSFQLAPMLPGAGEDRRFCVLLLDRSVTRLLLLEGRTLTEFTRQFGEERFAVRETGGSRKVSDERSLDDDAFHHLRQVGERLFKWLERDPVEGVFIGCRKELWTEIEGAFPDNLLKQVKGRFDCDPGLIPVPEVQERMQPLVEELQQKQTTEAVERAIGGAASSGVGAIGAERMAEVMETGELMVALIAPLKERGADGQVRTRDAQPASVCTSCAHIQMGERPNCDLCGSATTVYGDLAEVVLRRGLKGSFKVLRVPLAMLPANANGFLAQLRFRADRSRNAANEAA